MLQAGNNNPTENRKSKTQQKGFGLFPPRSKGEAGNNNQINKRESDDRPPAYKIRRACGRSVIRRRGRTRQHRSPPPPARAYRADNGALVHLSALRSPRQVLTYSNSSAPRSQCKRAAPGSRLRISPNRRPIRSRPGWRGCWRAACMGRRMRCVLLPAVGTARARAGGPGGLAS
jgi:hypothetical protein